MTCHYLRQCVILAVEGLRGSIDTEEKMTYIKVKKKQNKKNLTRYGKKKKKLALRKKY